MESLEEMGRVLRRNNQDQIPAKSGVGHRARVEGGRPDSMDLELHQIELPTSREVGTLCAGWLSGSEATRQLLVEDPRLFLRARAQARGPPDPAEAGPAAVLLARLLGPEREELGARSPRPGPTWIGSSPGTGRRHSHALGRCPGGLGQAGRARLRLHASAADAARHGRPPHRGHRARRLGARRGLIVSPIARRRSQRRKGRSTRRRAYPSAARLHPGRRRSRLRAPARTLPPHPGSWPSPGTARRS